MKLEELVWQPRLSLGSSKLEIYLDGTFASDLAETSVEAEKRERLNEVGQELFENTQYRKRYPYQFYEDSVLVTGVQLTTDTRIDASRNTLPPSENDQIRYCSKNVDHRSERDMLLTLFSEWIRHQSFLTERNSSHMY